MNATNHGRVLIAVPSYNRPYDYPKHTGKWLPKVEGIDWKVFIEPQQYRYYAQTVAPDRLVTTAEGIKVNGAVSFIGRWAQERGYDYVFKIDDDMKFKSFEDGRFSASGDSHKAVMKHTHHLARLMDGEPSIGAISFYLWMESTNMMRKVRDTGEDFDFGHRDQRLVTAYLSRPEFMIPCDTLGFELEDLLVAILACKAGSHTLMYWKLQQSPIHNINAGGLQSWGCQWRQDEMKRTVQLVKEKLGVNIFLQKMKAGDKPGEEFAVYQEREILNSTILSPDHQYNETARALWSVA